MTDPRPTRTRFIVALWLCGLAGVLYLDRICMAQAIKPIQEDLHLTETELGYVMMAFTLAYGLFEIPTGRLGDRVGSRSVLTRIVIWWSLFTALTGVAWGFYSLVIMRFIFGAGEAGAFPNAARVISRWFPASERGRVQGLMLMASQIGGAAAPALAAYLIDRTGWRWTFGTFGVLGVIYAAGFCWWFRDDPAKHSSVNDRELAIIRIGQAETPARDEPIPWNAVLRNSGIWLLGITITLSAFNTYLYFSWFTKYLETARDVPNIDAGWLSSLVLAMSAAGVFVGGFVADRILRRGRDVVVCRRLLGSLCFIAAAVFLYAGSKMDSPVALAVFAGASSFCLHATLSSWWSAAIEQCGKHVGALFGLMNSMGVVGAMLTQWFVGTFADWRKSLGYTGREQWDPMFNVYVGVLLLAALTWAMYRKRPVA